MSPGPSLPVHRVESVSSRQNGMQKTDQYGDIGCQSSDVHGYLPSTSLQSGDPLQSTVQDGYEIMEGGEGRCWSMRLDDEHNF
jgi:hypothetical protein